uniref:Uncharacterized protein n=1 Tax=Entomophthora virgavirus A TaxID=2592730 RepID=A0A7G3KH64_9VIRU|nr:hypothetical protein [Entomophthora virgavirus A]
MEALLLRVVCVKFILLLLFCCLHGESQFTYEHISQNLQSRGLNVTAFLGKAILYYSRQPNNAVMVSTAYQLDLKITDIKMANSFCCACYRYGMNCPVCNYEGRHQCEYPNHDHSPALRRWYNYHFDFLYRLYFPKIINLPVAFISAQNFLYSPGVEEFLNLYSPPQCTRTYKKITYITGSEVFDCLSVVDINDDCPIALSSCDHNKAVEQPISGTHLKQCVMPPFFNRDLPYFKNSNRGYCNPLGYDVVLPAMLELSNSLLSDNLPVNWVPEYHRHNNNTIVYRTFNTSLYSDLFNHMADGKHFFSPYRSDYKYNFIYGDEVVLRDSRVFSSDHSWLGNILVLPPCLKYIPFEGGRWLCDDMVKNERVYPEGYLYADIGQHFVDRVVEADVITDLPAKHISCNMVSKAGICLLEKPFDGFLSKFFGNFSLVMNDTVRSGVELFIDALGRNVTNDGFVYWDSVKGVHRTVGGWFSDIFGALIEPFFKMFIDIVLKEFIPPLFSAFTTVLKDLADLLVAFSVQFSSVIIALVTALVELLVYLVHFFFCIIAVVESELLLFEYSILFLYLVSRVSNNVIFALIILIITGMVLGIRRRHPSFMLTLLNDDVYCANLTGYREKIYLYDYSFNVYYSSSKYTFHFRNASVVESKLY